MNSVRCAGAMKNVDRLTGEAEMRRENFWALSRFV